MDQDIILQILVQLIVQLQVLDQSQTGFNDLHHYGIKECQRSNSPKNWTKCRCEQGSLI